jgi:hypothetical protein
MKLIVMFSIVGSFGNLFIFSLEHYFQSSQNAINGTLLFITFWIQTTLM